MDRDKEDAITTVAIFIIVFIVGIMYFICYKEENINNRIRPATSVESIVGLESCGV